jgi:hypothetical protein
MRRNFSARWIIRKRGDLHPKKADKLRDVSGVKTVSLHLTRSEG